MSIHLSCASLPPSGAPSRVFLSMLSCGSCYSSSQPPESSWESITGLWVNGQGTCWVFNSADDSGIRVEPVPVILWVLGGSSLSESTLGLEEEEGHRVNSESMTMPLSSGREEKWNPLNCNLLHLMDCFLVVDKVMDSSTPGCPSKWIRTLKTPFLDWWADAVATLCNSGLMCRSVLE